MEVKGEVTLDESSDLGRKNNYPCAIFDCVTDFHSLNLVIYSQGRPNLIGVSAKGKLLLRDC